jgi:hypothetical protein
MGRFCALISSAGRVDDQSMKAASSTSKFIFVFITFWIFVAGSGLPAQPKPEAVAAFDTYIAQVESRLDKQHHSANGFLVPEDAPRLRAGEQIIEQVPPPSGTDLPGAMLHHWRGTAFAPGVTLADFERMMKDFQGYPRLYAPQVLQSLVLSRRADGFQVLMRTSQKHVLTVVLDMNLDVRFGRLDAHHGYSLSRSTDIAEIESPGTRKERALSPRDNHGFLWRLNTYWSYEERDGGLYMQIETVSLSRSVPEALGWAIKPFVESVPRESLEFTLRSTCDAPRKEKAS